MIFRIVTGGRIVFNRGRFVLAPGTEQPIDDGSLSFALTNHTVQWNMFNQAGNFGNLECNLCGIPNTTDGLAYGSSVSRPLEPLTIDGNNEGDSANFPGIPGEILPGGYDGSQPVNEYETRVTVQSSTATQACDNPDVWVPLPSGFTAAFDLDSDGANQETVWLLEIRRIADSQIVASALQTITAIFDVPP